MNQSIVSTATVNITSPPGSHGGGAMDPLTLLAEALALGGVACRRRALRRLALGESSVMDYARRCAASNQDFCARR